MVATTGARWSSMTSCSVRILSITHMDYGWLQALEPEKDGTFKQHKVVVTIEDREIVTRQIVDTYQKIQNMELSTDAANVSGGDAWYCCDTGR